MADAAMASVFGAVLAVCDRQGLIGRAMLAIDGVKLPSNASKYRSGTCTERAGRASKLAKETQRIAALEADALQLRAWLAAHPTDRHGPTGGERKSNLTDNDSAKMATGKGVIQGFTGVAAVDVAHQIIVEAPAFGTGAEQECLLPVVTALAPQRAADTLITADAGYHSEANLAALAAGSAMTSRAPPRIRRRCCSRWCWSRMPTASSAAGRSRRPVASTSRSSRCAATRRPTSRRLPTL